MSKSTRYFQLTSDILLEYNYSSVNSAGNQEGTSEDVIDLKNNIPSSIINNGYDGTRTFTYDSNFEGVVLPVNTSESKFIQGVSDSGSKIWDVNTDISLSPIDGLTENNCDIVRDTFRIQFTSRNYLGDYDGFILRVTLYDSKKNKIGLFSRLIKKTDDLELNENPMLLNQKLYTTYMDFELPSTDALLNMNKVGGKSELEGEDMLYSELFPTYSVYGDETSTTYINTPIVFTLYGVKSIIDKGYGNSFDIYTAEKISSIFVPVRDDYTDISIHIEEASDGDYFEIYPVVDDGSVSFSDYIYNISDERPDTYIIFHEISLTEYYTDNTGAVRSEVTHRQQSIVNAAMADGDSWEINEDQLDDIMTYRPVVKNSGRIVSIVVEDTMKIINTLDNTTVVKTGSVSCSNPKKYGKKLNKIYLGEIPAQVNVYNKRPDDDLDSVKITNSSSNVKIENHQHSVIGFIECANVGVTIEQLPKETVE